MSVLLDRRVNFARLFLGGQLTLWAVATAEANFYFTPGRASITGHTSIEYSRTLFDTVQNERRSDSSLQNDFTFQQGGRGYIWRPWFSDLSADARLHVVNNAGWGDSDAETHWDGEMRTRLDLVPRSHVPFSADLSYRRNDQQHETWALGLDQGWKTFSPYLPDFFFEYDFQHNSLDGAKNWQHGFNSRMDGRVRGHEYRASLNLLDINTRGEISSSDTTTFNFNADHRKAWLKSLSVSEFLALYDSTTRANSSGQRSGIDSNGERVNALLSWSPSRDWGVNAGVSISNDESALKGGESFSTQLFSADLSATRRFGLSHRLTSSITYDQRKGLTASTERGYEVRYFWSPSVISFSGLQYQRDLSLGAAAVSSDTQRSESYELSAGHGVRSDFDFMSGSVGWSMDQSGRVNRRDGERDGGLTHRVSLSWSGGGEAIQDSILLSLSDQRLYGGENQQFVDVLASRKGVLGDFSRWDLTLDYQWGRKEQGSAVVTDSDAGLDGSVRMSYQRSNVFGLFNLYYVTSMDLNFGYESADDLLERGSSWDNSFIYSLGRLSAQLTVTVTESDEGAVGEMRVDIRRRWDSR